MHLGLFMECDYRPGVTEEEALQEAFDLAVMVVWRNANESRRPGHFYAPYAGQESAADFQAFYRDPFVLFESELPDLYRWKP